MFCERETAVASAGVIRVLITTTFLLSVRWFVLRHISLIFGQWRFAKGLAHPYLVVWRAKEVFPFEKARDEFLQRISVTLPI